MIAPLVGISEETLCAVDANSKSKAVGELCLGFGSHVSGTATWATTGQPYTFGCGSANSNGGLQSDSLGNGPIERVSGEGWASIAEVSSFASLLVDIAACDRATSPLSALGGLALPVFQYSLRG